MQAEHKNFDRVRLTPPVRRAVQRLDFSRELARSSVSHEGGKAVALCRAQGTGNQRKPANGLIRGVTFLLFLVLELHHALGHQQASPVQLRTSCHASTVAVLPSDKLSSTASKRFYDAFSRIV